MLEETWSKKLVRGSSQQEELLSEDQSGELFTLNVIILCTRAVILLSTTWYYLL